MMKSISKILIFINTLRYIKFKQLYYQMLYRLSQRGINNITCPDIFKFHNTKITRTKESLQSFTHFSFMGISKEIKSWDHPEEPLLWQYHLHYMDNLLKLSREDGVEQIRDWLYHLKTHDKISLSPYPTSRRIFNWILFFSDGKEIPRDILKSLFQQINLLEQKIEYHIDANHLFINILILFTSSVVTKDTKKIKKYKELLKNELSNQFYDSGLHYEGCPSYHSLMLRDMMYSYTVVKLYKNVLISDVTLLLEQKIKNAYQYYIYLVSPDGTLYQFGDTNKSNSVPTTEINNLYHSLFKSNEYNEKEFIDHEYYKKIKLSNLTLMIKLRSFTPSFQPGHSHCDIGSYELFFDNHKIITDIGCSTYEENEIRLKERDQISHNISFPISESQAEIWKSFRVGKRSKTIYKMRDDLLICKYPSGEEISRVVKSSEKQILITDKSTSKAPLISHIHLTPSCETKKLHDSISLKIKDIELKFTSKYFSNIEDCNIASDFNKKHKSKRIILKSLSGEIEYKIERQ